MPEITKRVRIEKILTFSIEKKIFSKLANRFDMITDSNIKGMNFSRWMSTVLFLTAREQAEFNQGFFVLVLEKV